MSRRNRSNAGHRIPTPSSEPAKTQEQVEDRPVAESQCPSPTAVVNVVQKEPVNVDPSVPEVSGRERLKRHRIEMAGRVWIPEIWGQEDFLKDWIDSSAFNSSLVPNGLMSARAALIEESHRANSGKTLRNLVCNLLGNNQKGSLQCKEGFSIRNEDARTR
ncbi:PREDICTED: uncharacterized protein LOC104588614 [Nelumbo nucifera]|uniref:Uncharacterized protein LOC104588614 n=1 Tax=Nelumbo nucifera TaxID=4432 RepID=A0A1U7ZAX9_NELNU|nr:PREDICTED: uncharacterized protein LOC104588614 [Nelumbo nucifera]